MASCALVKLLVDLTVAPLLAQDCALFVYPMLECAACLPPTSDDLKLPFAEITQSALLDDIDGAIVIRTNQDISGLRILADNRTTAVEVGCAAVEQARKWIPLADDPVAFDPALDPDHARFHLTIETPRAAGWEAQINAVVVAIKSILGSYSSLRRYSATI